MSDLSVLFTPTRLGALESPNRVLLAPMTRSRADRDEVPGPRAAYYAQRASAGLIITEATQVGPGAQGYIHAGRPHQRPGCRLAGVTDAVHAAGGRIVVQLWHCGRVSHESFSRATLCRWSPRRSASRAHLHLRGRCSRIPRRGRWRSTRSR